MGNCWRIHVCVAVKLVTPYTYFTTVCPGDCVQLIVSERIRTKKSSGFSYGYGKAHHCECLRSDSIPQFPSATPHFHSQHTFGVKFTLSLHGRSLCSSNVVLRLSFLAISTRGNREDASRDSATDVLPFNCCGVSNSSQAIVCTPTSLLCIRTRVHYKKSSKSSFNF